MISFCHRPTAVANPDLDIREDPNLFACPAGFSSFCNVFFTQNKRGAWVPPLDPPL